MNIEHTAALRFTAELHKGQLSIGHQKDAGRVYKMLWNTVRGSGLTVPAAAELVVFLPDAKKALRLIESLMLSTTSGMNVVAFAVRSRILKTAFWLRSYSLAKISVMRTVDVLICAK